MPQRTTSDYAIPTIADIIFCSVFLYLALVKGQDLLADADTGYHIRAGEYILSTLSVPTRDLFSFITPTLPWTAHEWLSEAAMALLHSSFGLTGVVVFYAFLIGLVYYLLFKTLRSRGGNIFIATAVTVLVAATSQIHWLARPHIFSLLIMVVWYRMLDNFQYRGKDQLMWFPPMMLLWVNLHGGYLAGFILLGIYAAGNVVMACGVGGAGQEGARDRFFRLCDITLLSLLASLVNPIGYKILLFPFHVVGNRYLMDHVVEFLSPNFHEPITFKYLFLLTVALLVVARKRLNVIEVLLLLIFTNMALFAVRYVTLFALVIAPIILERADDLLAASPNRFCAVFRQRSERFAATDGRARGFFWPLVACVAAGIMVVAHTVTWQFSEKLKPVAAVEFLLKEHISGNMYNNDEIGDYVIYAAWPRYRVFFDGRSDMYGAEHMKAYYRIHNFEPGWEKVTESYGMDWIFIDANSQLSRYLLARGGWCLIYSDRVAHIFVKDVAKYRGLIAKYPHVKPLEMEQKE